MLQSNLVEGRASHDSVTRLLFVSTLLVSAAIAASEGPPAFDAGADNQLGLTFTPDGKRAFWTEWNGAWGDEAGQRVIFTAERRGEAWTEPVPAPFSQRYSDDDPFVSPDGSWLYFVSERPAHADDEEPDADIWRFSLAGDDRLERLSVNSTASEYSPVVTSSGALYFASARGGGRGQGDLYRAAPAGADFAPPEILGPAINSPTGEWNLWVAPDESEILFEASSREANMSRSGDLYYSWRSSGGWTAAVPLTSLNTAGSELMPRLDPTGDTLYYATATMGGHAQIATADWRELRVQLRNDYAPILLVANRSSHEVSFVNLARGEVIARVPTGEGPHLLSNVSDGRVLATGYGEFPRPHAEPVAERPPFVESLNSRLTLIDLEGPSVLLDGVIGDCEKPHASWLVGDQAYVTCETGEQVLALDLETGLATRAYPTRQQGSHVLGFDAGSGTLAVSNTESGSVTLIDIDSGETSVVKLGAGSEGMLVVGKRVWVGNATEGSVSVVNLDTRKETARTEPLCNFPISLGARKEDIWIACFGSSELVAIDAATLRQERRIALEANPLHLLLHPRLNVGYVSLPRANAIAEIDLESGEELRRIRVGIEPDGLRWAE